MQNVYKGSMALVCSVLLAACGGGGSDGGGGTGSGGGTAGSGGGATSTFVGVVADGYLVNATVCLDLNNNKVCDAGEPSATTTAGGAFSIDATQDQIDNSPVILEATAGVTIDEDTNTTVAKDFTLTAPAGADFVSPLTTLVQAEIEANENIAGYTVADASAAVQTALGTSVDVLEDYIAQEDLGGAGADHYQRLHEIAQVATQIIATNTEAVNTAATAQGATSTEGELFELVIAEVSEVIDVISDAVDADTATTFDPAVVVAAVSSETALDTTDVDDQVDQQQLEQTAVIANIGALISSAGGLNWFWIDYENQTYEGLETGKLTYDSVTTVTTDIEWDVQSDGSLVVRTPGTPDLVLGSSGWLDDDEKVSVATINTDGSVELDVKTDEGITYAGEKLAGQLVDVSGQAIAHFILAEEGGFDATSIVGNAVFSTGAEAYQMTFTTIGDYYFLWEWDGCSNPALTGGSCNTVWHQNGDGNSSNDANATVMSDVIESSAANPSIVLTDASSLNALEIGYNPNLRMEMVSDGSANFYTIDFASNAATKVGTGTWTQLTVSGAILYLIDVPADLADNADVDSGETLLLSVRNGFVRRGSFEPNGTVSSDEEWVFNSVAQQDILANYSEPVVLLACNYESGWDGVNNQPATFNSFSDFQGLLTSCGGALPTTNADVIGTWIETISATEQEQLVFNSDFTFTLTDLLNGSPVSGSTISGTWSVNNSLITMTYGSLAVDIIAVTSQGMRLYVEEVSWGADLIADAVADGEIETLHFVKQTTALTCNYESPWDSVNDQPASFNSYTDFLTVVADCGGAQTTVSADLVGTWFDHNVVNGVIVDGETVVFNANGTLTFVEIENDSPVETLTGTWSVANDLVTLQIGSPMSFMDTWAITAGGLPKIYTESIPWSDFVLDSAADGDIWGSGFTKQP